MPTFLFWNLNKKRLATTLGELAREQDADILILTESGNEPVETLQALNSVEGATYYYAQTLAATRPQVYVRYSPNFIEPFYDDPYLTIRRIRFPAMTELLLAAVHFPSLMHLSVSDLSRKASEMIQVIEDREKSAGHARTLVMGDFNMNPFAEGLISATGFNAVGVRDIARQKTRIVSGKTYNMFFNPMWEHFSDGESRAAGTYFYPPKGYDSVYWHIFDQALVRPDLMDWVQRENLTIIRQCGALPLVDSRGRPSVSDHLPIKIKLQPP